MCKWKPKLRIAINDKQTIIRNNNNNNIFNNDTPRSHNTIIAILVALAVYVTPVWNLPPSLSNKAFDSQPIGSAAI